MKLSNIICVALAIALAIVTWKFVEYKNTQSEVDTAADSSSGAYDNIMTRASCRTYSKREVSKEAVDSLLKAGMAAPTARDQRAWRFFVIDDRAILDSIASNCQNIKMAADAPLAIVVCGDLDIARAKDAEEFWVQDCSAATENILLAAHSMGLGAVWCGIYPIEERVRFISGLLNLPSSFVPLNVIPVGYPAAAISPKEKYDADRIHHDRYKD